MTSLVKWRSHFIDNLHYIFVLNIKRKNAKNKTVLALTLTLNFNMTTNADVNQVAETIVLAFVSQQAAVQAYVPLGFACDINATNIQITISKL